MARTYEEIEKDIIKIRKDLIEGIREALEVSGYSVGDTVLGEYVSVKVGKDRDHILVCDKRHVRDAFCDHVNSCSLDTLLEAYRTVLCAWPNF